MATYPTIATGQRVTAAMLTDMQTQTYVKQSNETRTSTTTYANDAELAGIPLAVGTYEIIGQFAMIGGAGGIAIKTQWSFTGTWSGPLRLCEGPTSGNTTAGSGAVSTQRSAYATNADCVYGLSTSAVYTTVMEISKQITVTVAGNMALSWAPNVSSATSGGIRQSSWIDVKRIA
jgi:hypothetical protein